MQTILNISLVHTVSSYLLDYNIVVLFFTVSSINRDSKVKQCLVRVYLNRRYINFSLKRHNVA